MKKNNPLLEIKSVFKITRIFDKLRPNGFAEEEIALALSKYILNEKKAVVNVPFINHMDWNLMAEQKDKLEVELIVMNRAEFWQFINAYIAQIPYSKIKEIKRIFKLKNK